MMFKHGRKCAYVLLICAVFAVLTACNGGQETGTPIYQDPNMRVGDFYWRLDAAARAAAGIAWVNSYVGTNPEVNIPTRIEGRSVRHISDRAFYHNTVITSVFVPDTVQQLGIAAFAGSSNLTSVRLPEALRMIPQEAFARTGLLQITLPRLLINIGEAAFEGCSYLQNLVLPDTVQRIGAYAFRHCIALTEMRIPRSVEVLPGSAFVGCSSLQAITVDERNIRFISVEGVLFARSHGDVVPTLLHYPQGKLAAAGGMAVLPDWVVALGDYAFASNTALSQLEIPQGVTTIGDWVFAEASNLERVFIPASVVAIGADAFTGAANVTIYAPEGSYAQQFAQTAAIPFVAANR